MTQVTIQDIFSEYLSKQPIFSTKSALSDAYNPDNVPHRVEQIRQLSIILAPALKLEKPSNIFIYGSTGTGKTLVTKHVTGELSKIAEKNNVKLTVLYVNCKMKRVADTEYRLLAYICELLGKNVPATGLPTDSIYKIFYTSLEERGGVVILVVDEIDALVKKIGDEFLYNLTRINQNLSNVRCTILGISNDLSFTEFLDARVRSSLSEEELIFPPYNAIQLQEVLQTRAIMAFNKNKVEEGVVPKCAALAAQEHGDARRALDLLRVAGELAEREGANTVSEKHVSLAESKVDTDRVLDAIKTQPKQTKAVSYSVFSLLKENERIILTGNVFDEYVKTCKKLSLKILTQRRFSDILSELDLLGIINSRIISKGRHGRTREISSSVSEDVKKKILTYLSEEFYF